MPDRMIAEEVGQGSRRMLGVLVEVVLGSLEWRRP